MRNDKNATCCQNCGGTLVYEEFFQVGHQYVVKKDGTLYKRFKRTSENSEEASMLYCRDCHEVIDFDDYDIHRDMIILHKMHPDERAAAKWEEEKT